MAKQRVLITETEEAVAENLASCLEKEYDVLVCADGDQLMRHINEFEPDVLILDLSLRSCDPPTIIHTIKSAGKPTEILVVSSLCDQNTIRIYGAMGICGMIPKPYKLDYVMSCVHFAVAVQTDWSDDSRLAYILGSIGFALGTTRAWYIQKAVLLWHDANGTMTAKRLYLELSQLCGNSPSGIEKAIRDAIHHAWNRGDRELWAAYFSASVYIPQHCPSNEVFIARMAQSLWTKEQLKRPYKKAE